MSTIFPLPHSERRFGPYTASAGQTDFPGAFGIQADSDVVVTRTRAGTLATLVLDTDYEVIGVNVAAGFTIRLLTGAQAGDIIAGHGLAVIERTTSVVQAGQFNSRQLDRELDRSRIIDMETRRDLDAQGVRLSDLETLVDEAGYTVPGDLLAAKDETLAARVETLAARDATLAAFDSFDDRYLGAKAADPTVDNDGNPLVAGMLYFNSSTGVMRIYTGTAWVAAYVSGTDFLTKTGNLSDLASVATARANLGLGSAAVQASSAFAAAAHTHPATGVTGGVRGSGRGLSFSNDPVTPSGKMLVTAKELVLKNAGTGLLLTDVSVAITMGTAGLNSLDTGSEAPSAWYYIWVVSDGTNVAGLFSTSFESCATIGAYAYKAPVGAVYNDASSNFRLTHGTGNGRIEQADVVAYSGGPGTGWAAISLSTSVPPVAVRAYGRGTTTGNNNNAVQLSPEAGASGPGLRHLAINTLGLYGLVGTQYDGSSFDIPIVEAQTIYRRATSTNAVQIIVNGFDIPMGL